MKKFNKDLIYLILCWLFIILALIPTFAHHGNLLVDCGREVYYPTQILDGKVLYKDIFNIYGPFSYMFNALLFKVFGIKLSVLYISGCICTFIITSLTYLISRRFLSEFLSFSITVFTISIGVLSLHIFNFVFPYSYAMLYGLVSFLISFWCLLKYQEKNETSYLYLSSFFAGLAIINKYEFIPYLLIIFYASIKIKKLDLKQYFWMIISFLSVPSICFGILFFQGLGTKDLVDSAIIVNKIAHSQSLKYFYTKIGLCFNKATPLFLIQQFFKTITPLSLFVYCFKTKRRFLPLILMPVSVLLMTLFINVVSFVFIPVLILALTIFYFKKLCKNYPLFILTFSAMFVSLKVFWALTSTNYGLFFISFLIMTLLALLFELVDIKKYQTAIATYILIVAAILGYQNLSGLKTKNHLIKSDRGNIYTVGKIYSASNELIEYINKNTKKTDQIVILPEGAFINFLTDRKTDNFYNSLIPLYIEVFGEDKIIENFKKSKPEYIIFDNWEVDDYYFKYICNDYATKLCSYVAQNYTQEKVIDNTLRYLIFKKK